MSPFFLVSVCCLVACGEQSGRTQIVSLVQFISSPDRYVGSSVSFVGFLARFQSVAVIYLTEDHAKFGDLSPAVTIEMDLDAVAEDCFGRYVQIDGQLKMVDAILTLSEISKIYGDLDEIGNLICFDAAIP